MLTTILDLNSWYFIHSFCSLRIIVAQLARRADAERLHRKSFIQHNHFELASSGFNFDSLIAIHQTACCSLLTLICWCCWWEREWAQLLLSSSSWFVKQLYERFRFIISQSATYCIFYIYLAQSCLCFGKSTSALSPRFSFLSPSYSFFLSLFSPHLVLPP